MGSILSIIADVVAYTIKYVLIFAWWFYTSLLPFVIQYIGVPLFALGILLALAFAGGTIAFTIVFFIFMFYFIRETVFKSAPPVK